MLFYPKFLTANINYKISVRNILKLAIKNISYGVTGNNIILQKK
jgi:hypothetical protein